MFLDTCLTGPLSKPGRWRPGGVLS